MTKDQISMIENEDKRNQNLFILQVVSRVSNLTP